MSTDYLTTVFQQVGAQGLANTLEKLNREFGETERHGEKMRAAGLAMTGGAVAMGLFTNHIVQAGNEAANTSLKLDGMLRVRGESGARAQLDAVAESLSKATGIDDDLFTDAQAHLLSFGLSAQQISQVMPGLTGQANTMGQSLESVADSFGRAFASGNAGALSRSGVVLSKADKDAIEAAKSISEAAGQQELFNRVLASYQQYAVRAGEGISDAARAQGNFNTQLGNTQELMGQGAGDARVGMYETMGAALERINKQNPELVKTMGALMQYGQLGAAIAGPITTGAGAWLQWRDSKNIARLATEGLEKAVRSEALAEVEKTGIANVEAGALRNSAAAAGEAAEKTTMLARAKGLLGTPIGGLQMVGGAPVTAGAAMLGVGLGIGAGVGAGNDYRDAGYSNPELKGAATGVATAAAAMFLPGAVVPIAMALAARQMVNHFVTEPMDDYAENGARNDKGEVINNERGGGGTAMGEARYQWKRAQELNKEADDLVEGGAERFGKNGNVQALRDEAKTAAHLSNVYSRKGRGEEAAQYAQQSSEQMKADFDAGAERLRTADRNAPSYVTNNPQARGRVVTGQGGRRRIEFAPIELEDDEADDMVDDAAAYTYR